MGLVRFRLPQEGWMGVGIGARLPEGLRGGGGGTGAGRGELVFDAHRRGWGATG